MMFRRFYCTPLAQAAYLIGHDGEAAVVDPPRDIAEITAFAARQGLRIRWALSTHVHADFCAGLAELAAATGATVGLGERFDGALPCERLADDRELRIGGAVLTVLPTPGHTPESVSFLLRGPAASGAPDRLLSGDTLFLGDVGRPDLVAGRGLPPEQMARALFRSLHERLAPLPDTTEVWPAHGAGSACGTDISCEESSTIGLQRVGNWALAERDEDAFCARLLAALRPPPRYFARVAAVNRRGPALLGALPAPRQLDAAGVQRHLDEGGAVLDVRSRQRHADGHWPGALNAASDGNDFETWAGSLLEPDATVVLHVAEHAQLAPALARLRRIGLDAVVGWTDAPAAAPRTHRQLAASELFVALQGGAAWQIVDVRRPAEFAAAHLDGAVHAELGPGLAAHAALAALDRAMPTAVICRSGYRSSAALRQLHEMGFRALANVQDGMLGWQGNHLPTSVG
ncbi:MAG: rhodanese-like domain-containing protein [Planctomycetota bacterium]